MGPTSNGRGKERKGSGGEGREKGKERGNLLQGVRGDRPPGTTTTLVELS